MHQEPESAKGDKSGKGYIHAFTGADANPDGSGISDTFREILENLVIDALDSATQHRIIKSQKALDGLKGNQEAREQYESTAEINNLTRGTADYLRSQMRGYLKEIVTHHRKYFVPVVGIDKDGELPPRVPKRAVEMVAASDNTLARQFFEGMTDTYASFRELCASAQAKHVDAKVSYKDSSDLLFDIKFDIEAPNRLGKLAYDFSQKIYNRLLCFEIIQDCLRAINVCISPEIIQKSFLPAALSSAENPWDMLEKRFQGKLDIIQEVVEIAYDQDKSLDEIDQIAVALIKKGCRSNRYFLVKHGLMEAPAKSETVPDCSPKKTLAKLDSKEKIKTRLAQYESFNSLDSKSQNRTINVLARFSEQLLTDAKLEGLFSNSQISFEAVTAFARSLSVNVSQSLKRGAPSADIKAADELESKVEKTILQFDTSEVDAYVADLPEKFQRQFESFTLRNLELKPHEFAAASGKITHIAGSQGVCEYAIDKYRFYFYSEEGVVKFIAAGDKDSQRTDIIKILSIYGKKHKR